MKKRSSTTWVSALVLTLCMLTFIPGGLRFASTWRELYLETNGIKEQNLLVPLGFCALGFAMVAIIVIWTGFIKQKRWAWFVMLIIAFCFVFPSSTLTLFVSTQTPSFLWSEWFRSIREGFPPAVWMARGVFTFLMMLFALILPMKKFFWSQADGKPVVSPNNG